MNNVVRDFEKDKNVIENPCYHCYAGASGQCYMTSCKHQFEIWSKDVESEYVEIKGENKNGK